MPFSQLLYTWHHNNLQNMIAKCHDSLSGTACKLQILVQESMSHEKVVGSWLILGPASRACCFFVLRHSLLLAPCISSAFPADSVYCSNTALASCSLFAAQPAFSALPICCSFAAPQLAVRPELASLPRWSCVIPWRLALPPTPL